MIFPSNWQYQPRRSRDTSLLLPADQIRSSDDFCSLIPLVILIFPGTGKKTADTDLQAVPAAKDSLGLRSGEIPKRDVGWRSAATINFLVKMACFESASAQEKRPQRGALH
jgi:hypothetical protein